MHTLTHITTNTHSGLNTGGDMNKTNTNNHMLEQTFTQNTCALMYALEKETLRILYQDFVVGSYYCFAFINMKVKSKKFISSNL